MEVDVHINLWKMRLKHVAQASWLKPLDAWLQGQNFVVETLVACTLGDKSSYFKCVSHMLLLWESPECIESMWFEVLTCGTAFLAQKLLRPCYFWVILLLGLIFSMRTRSNDLSSENCQDERVLQKINYF